jgi:hypothetical protein
VARTTRIQGGYDDPSASPWRGQSTKENIGRWSERAHKESDGARHRAQSGEIELPTGSMRDSYPGSAKSGEDARRIAKAEVNHSGRDSSYDATLALYGAKNVRRQA